ncbi:hypothetical protein C5E07_16535 [Pseudoclavibacter sp. RFBJ3]|uniref:copper resistance D family protein n=1 Tax=unclassified Pseudoclavibacter TaxID=2615177 RepID=UPI000CE9371F|nr:MULTISPECIES: CopD family protein [unclassified Pseudoclavibacter]PPF87545.1 hypothetical protein C5C12_00345 [Pseudoclavibacter sp. RFBJ5]PPF90395.1 hypothetical protein C5E07_16535 [Pseudoclavibacter sp. RFBJ3]PPG01080.1 hypothetical protein C5C19_00345 [Pseudoclavibacter sp. RFBH5]PPG26183.1 hypothetical protein C5E13_00300 [Pseudoclavibacter sp. RFBI4]
MIDLLLADPFASASPSAEAALQIAAGLFYLALLTMTGLVVFDVAILTGESGFRFRRWIVGAGAIAVLAVLALVPLTALRIAAEPLSSALTSMAWTSTVLPSTRLTAVLVSGGVLLVTLFVFWRARSARPWALCGALLVVSVPALEGHTRSVQPLWVMVGADIVHLLAAAVWCGGVLGLLCLVAPRRLLKGGQRGARAIEVAGVVARFSTVALWALVAVACSGVLMGVLILGDPLLVLSTSYGRSLLVKVGLVASVVVLAAWNRRSLSGWVAGRKEEEQRLQRLRRTLLTEALLLIAVIAVTGVLTSGSPSHSH